jgi:hypothetical protein
MVCTDEQIAAMRGEIRRAGEWVLHLRYAVGGTILGFALLLALVAVVGNLLHFSDEADPLTIASLIIPQWIAAPVASASVGLIGVVCIALPMAAGVRALWRLRIGRRLSRLNEHDRAAVLLHLGSGERDDTRKVVAGLARRFKLPAEVIPAAALDARGDEASPAKRRT